MKLNKKKIIVLAIVLIICIILGIILGNIAQKSENSSETKSSQDLEKYALIIDLDGGEYSTPYDRTTYDSSMEFSLPDVVKDGYRFLGWTGSNGAIPQENVKITKGTTGDLEFKANWQEQEEQEPVSAE